MPRVGERAKPGRATVQTVPAKRSTVADLSIRDALYAVLVHTGAIHHHGPHYNDIQLLLIARQFINTVPWKIGDPNEWKIPF